MRYTLKDFIEEDPERANQYLYMLPDSNVLEYSQIKNCRILMSSNILVDHMNFIVKIK